MPHNSPLSLRIDLSGRQPSLPSTCHPPTGPNVLCGVAAPPRPSPESCPARGPSGGCPGGIRGRGGEERPSHTGVRRSFSGHRLILPLLFDWLVSLCDSTPVTLPALSHLTKCLACPRNPSKPPAPTHSCLVPRPRRPHRPSAVRSVPFFRCCRRSTSIPGVG